MLVRRREGGTLESSADGADGATGGCCCRTSTWTGVSVWSRGQEVIPTGDPGQGSSQSIGPEWSERVGTDTIGTSRGPLFSERRRKRTTVCSSSVPSQRISLMLQSVFSQPRHFWVLMPSDLRRTLASRLDILLAVAPHDLQLKGLSQLNLSLSKSVPHNKQLFKIFQW